MTQQEFDELKATVAGLKSDFDAKLVVSSVEEPLKAAIAGLDAKIALGDQLRLMEDQIRSWKLWLRVMGAVVATLLGVLGFFGYQTVEKWRGDLQQTVKKAVQAGTFVGRELSLGLALQTKYPEFAKDHLKAAFDVDTYDEPVVSGVLLAADSSDDWDMAKGVLDKLAGKPSGTPEFRESWTYNAIGLAAINVSFQYPTYLDFARDNFTKGVILAGSDPDSLWYLHTNFWRYYLAKNDHRGAQCEADRAAAVGAPDGADTLEKAMQWRWFQVYFQTPKHVERPEVEKMFKQFSMPRKPGDTLSEMAKKLSTVNLRCR